MIPTREQIDEHYSVNALAWLRAMRDEIDRLTDANANLTRQVEWEQRAWPMWMEKALGKPLEGRTPSMVQVQLTKRFDAIQADLDRANTEAALARDALAKATTPAPEREAAIQAWEEDATLHRCGSRFDDDDPRATYLMARSEITAAVALMRSAGDPDAKLRELRAWIIDEKWCAPGIVRKIDEMLARPCPEVPETPKIQPSEDREAKIEAWEKEALTVESDEGIFGQGYFILRRSEITEAVALMRSADGKALLRELRAKATTPAPEREAAIRMLERRALQYLDHSEKSRFSSDGEGYRDEITAAVAMIRSATDGKALLRELRAWVSEQNYNGGFGTVIQASRILAAIDRLLSLDLDRVDPKPAPVEQPAAAVPDDIGLGPVTDEMVQSGIAAVKDGRWITLEQLRKELAPAPDDTRELVAQLADVAAAFFVSPWGDRARAIAEKLRAPSSGSPDLDQLTR